MFDAIAGWIAIVIEGAGIAIVAIGAVISTWHFVHAWRTTRSFEAPYQAYRGNLV